MAATGTFRLNMKWKVGCARRFSNISRKLRSRFLSRQNRGADIVRVCLLLLIDRDFPDWVPFLLEANRYRNEALDDRRVGGSVQRGFGRTERATSCQSNGQQQLISQVFVHWDFRLQPCLRGLNRFL